MVRHQFWLCLNGFREVLLESVGDRAVQLLPFSSRQAGVRGILHQRMFENIRRIRRSSPAKDQISSCELRKSSIEQCVRYRCYRGEQLIRAFSTKCGADLCDLFDLGKSIKTCHKRIVQCCRNR